MHDDGLWGQWRQGALAIRTLAHIGVAAESTHGRSPIARVAMLAYSLGVDTWVATRRRTTRRRPRLETVANMIDVAGWSWLARDAPIHLQGLSLATIAPNLLETGFRLGAGTATVPVIEPASPWRPMWAPSLRTWVRSRTLRPTTDAAAHIGPPRPDLARVREVGGILAADLVPSLSAMILARRSRGQRVGAIPLVWAGLGALGGYGLARTRAGAQAHTTQRWGERSAYLIEEARIRSRVQSALVHNTARVDPKAMLTLLERSGSAAAQRALDELASEPGVAYSTFADRGVTLSGTVDLRTVNPTTYATRWVPKVQVRAIRDAIAAIDDRLGPTAPETPDDDQVTVVTADPRRLVLAYRGETIEATQPMPDLAIRLEPTVWVVVASAVLTLVNGVTSPDRASTRALVGAAILQALAVGRVLSTEPVERRGDRVTAALLTASTLMIDVSVARGGQNRHATDTAAVGETPPQARSSDAEPLEVCAGTSATQPMMMLLGTSWHDLQREGPVLLGIALAGWVASLRPWQGRSWHSAVVEAAFLFTPLLANLGVGARTDHEADLLDIALQERLSETIDTQARLEADREVARFVRQLDVVIDELPTRHPGLSDSDVTEIIAAYRAERSRIVDADPLELIGW